jgi:release factor glutamine methyltransferase
LPEAVAVTVRDALARGAARLAQAGCASPRLDAEVLMGSVLGVDRARLVIDARVELSLADADAFAGLVARRAAREPVAYITGVREFRRLSLHVDPRVLIPRPETELLVEVALQLAPGARVVDVGTGSGAVALAVKDERPDLAVLGFDVSADAVAVAAGNAAALGLDVSFEVADLLAGVDLGVDAVLANLPYVAAGDADRLAPEIVRYEPPGALYGGADGLDVVRRLVAMAGPVPFLALEIGAGQAAPVSALLTGAGFGSVVAERDLAGIERVMVGRR